MTQDGVGIVSYAFVPLELTPVEHDNLWWFISMSTCSLDQVSCSTVLYNNYEAFQNC